MKNKNYEVGVYEERLRVLALITEEIDDMFSAMPTSHSLSIAETDYVRTLMRICYLVATAELEE